MSAKTINDMELRKAILNKIRMPYKTLRMAFEKFSKKWEESQNLGPLDKKDMDTLILESLYEAIEKEK